MIAHVIRTMSDEDRSDTSQARAALEAYHATFGDGGNPLSPTELPYALAAATLRRGDAKPPTDAIAVPVAETVRLGAFTWAIVGPATSFDDLSYENPDAHADALDAFLEPGRRKAGPGPDLAATLYGAIGPDADPALPDGPFETVRELQIVEQTMLARERAGEPTPTAYLFAGPECEMDEMDWREERFQRAANGACATPSRPAERAIHLVAALVADHGVMKDAPR